MPHTSAWSVQQLAYWQGTVQLYRGAFFLAGALVFTRLSESACVSMRALHIQTKQYTSSQRHMYSHHDYKHLFFSHDLQANHASNDGFLYTNLFAELLTGLCRCRCHTALCLAMLFSRIRAEELHAKTLHR